MTRADPERTIRRAGQAMIALAALLLGYWLAPLGGAPGRIAQAILSLPQESGSTLAGGRTPLVVARDAARQGMREADPRRKPASGEGSNPALLAVRTPKTRVVGAGKPLTSSPWRIAPVVRRALAALPRAPPTV